MKNFRQFNYLPAVLINLILAAPFIEFLIWPHNSSNPVIGNAIYLLFLKIVSFSLTTQLIMRKQGGKFPFSQLLISLLILYLVYTKTGYILLIYFFGNLLVDLLSIKRTPDHKLLNKTMEAIAKFLLLFGLIFPSAILSSFIHKRYFEIISSRYDHISSYKDSESFIAVIVLFILYYLLEPLAMQLFNLFFNPKSKLALFLNKKL